MAMEHIGNGTTAGFIKVAADRLEEQQKYIEKFKIDLLYKERKTEIE